MEKSEEDLTIVGFPCGCQFEGESPTEGYFNTVCEKHTNVIEQMQRDFYARVEKDNQ